ncbi:transposon Ty3-I Gag-Pol polyprotein [Trichonephila inaurata madagascariensis]|uniref:Transposon Ty3-I Gag-Pol polyprotein n=1 Tax=Trichonephila inaurata madagascariensis TaxID=2747483 RepID=A0A8X6YRU3_9ARAC|nr:transposon Ty3-I Gag-Pol polyprotein [Trichonephila inaurata madagascariensis]
MVAEQYVWPAMRQDVVLWTRTCLQCQRSKVARHTRSEIGKFELPSSRFEHVHIDLVGPLPPSEGFRFCLPVWTGSPSGRRRFQWWRLLQRPGPRLSTLVGSPDSVLLSD